MAFSESLAERIRGIVARRHRITEKKMFGGICFLLHGNLLVDVWKDSLIARLGPDALWEALKGNVKENPSCCAGRVRHSKGASRMVRCGIVIAAFFTISLTGFAQDEKGPLAKLPSKAGAHVEKIKALGDNEWLELGIPAADPKWGKARGSSWGAKAPILAPDKRGAFLFGEGVHGYVKPDGQTESLLSC